MVQPSPADRLLNEVQTLAKDAPAQALARLDEVLGKTTEEREIQAVAALGANLAGSVLAQWDAGLALMERCLVHPALGPQSPVRRSVWRAKAVLLLGQGRKDLSTHALDQGASTPAERCRFHGMAAQTLAARSRFPEATTQLRLASDLAAGVPTGDEVVTQTAMIATNLLRMADGTAHVMKRLMLAATAALQSSMGRSDDWRARHRAWFHLGRAELQAGHAARSLAVVQQLMTLEDTHNAGPGERFHTAALACRAQTVRTQFRVAAAAFEACQDFCQRIDAGPARQEAESALRELEQFMAAAKP